MALWARKLREKISLRVSRFRFPHAVGRSMETARANLRRRSARRFDGELRPKLLVRCAVASWCTSRGGWMRQSSHTDGLTRQGASFGNSHSNHLSSEAAQVQGIMNFFNCHDR
jgi:hypothetical protein